MRKIISILAVSAFVLAAASWASAQTADSELERIPSPDQIKNFRVMQKIGSALYGIRLETNAGQNASDRAGNAAANQKAPAPAASANQALTRTNVAETLEKIAAPHLIPLYERIRQVGSALWGVKKGTDSASSTANGQEAKPQARPAVVSGETAACVSDAINDKDLELSEEVLSAATELREAILTRSTCQKAAVSLATNQRAELDICLKAFQTRHREINASHKEKHKAIWNTYRESLKACQARATNLEEGTEIIIDDGAESIVDSVTDISVE